MNNLHRELAPVSAAAWDDLEDEARRTFVENLAGRRVVDVVGPSGPTFAAVGTGHVRELDTPDSPVRTRLRQVAAVVELRVPFTVTRAAVDSVERGAKDADWQPVKDAARTLAYAEDRLVVDGLAAAGVVGLRTAAAESGRAAIELPAAATDYPATVAEALRELRLAGVAGGYALLLSADAYTAMDETTEDGYPVREHVARVLGEDGKIVWAPGIEGAVLLSTRGGDYELHLGQDTSVGYLSHDADTVSLYLEESLTFLVNTAEAAVALG